MNPEEILQQAMAAGDDPTEVLRNELEAIEQEINILLLCRRDDGTLAWKIVDHIREYVKIKKYLDEICCYLS